MKNIIKSKVLFMMTAIGVLVSFNGNSVLADELEPANEPYVEYSIDIEDAELENATIISTNSYTNDDRQITETVYRLSDGTIITDTLNTSSIAPYSSEGTDTVTRTREINGWATITIHATFKWYTQNGFSYVRCLSMNAWYSLCTNVEVDRFDQSYTSNYVAFGSAKAQVDYYFYNRNNPFNYREGTFKITCTDSGSISDH